jgi:hypothetical protein
MSSPVKTYQREMQQNLGFFATWLPGDPIAVGDIGRFVGGRFRRESSLAELGIAFASSQQSGGQDVQYTSSEGTKVSADAGMAIAGLTKTEMSIEFSQEGAFVFHATDLRTKQIGDRSEVTRGLLAALQAERWSKDWLLVDSVRTAERATIIVAEDKSAELGLTVSLSGNLPAMSLSDPRVEVAITRTKGKVVHIVGGKGIRPLYSCLQVVDPLIGRPHVKPVRGVDEGNGGAMLARPDIELLLNS